jgi:hypothetical protein
MEDNLLRINSMDFNKRAKELIENSLKVYDQLKIDPDEIKSLTDQVFDYSNQNREIRDHINYHNQQEINVF